MMEFGALGWPILDLNFHYLGPLGRCGHVHSDPTTGTDESGAFHSSRKAAYPSGMCKFIAIRAFRDWEKSFRA